MLGHIRQLKLYHITARGRRWGSGAALLVFHPFGLYPGHPFTHTITHTHPGKKASLCVHVKAIDFLPLYWSPDQYMPGTMRVNTPLKIRRTSALMSFCFQGLSPGKKKNVNWPLAEGEVPECPLSKLLLSDAAFRQVNWTAVFFLSLVESGEGESVHHPFILVVCQVSPVTVVSRTKSRYRRRG